MYTYTYMNIVCTLRILKLIDKQYHFHYMCIPLLVLGARPTYNVLLLNRIDRPTAIQCIFAEYD